MNAKVEELVVKIDAADALKRVIRWVDTLNKGG